MGRRRGLVLIAIILRLAGGKGTHNNQDFTLTLDLVNGADAFAPWPDCLVRPGWYVSASAVGTSTMPDSRRGTHGHKDSQELTSFNVSQMIWTE